MRVEEVALVTASTIILYILSCYFFGSGFIIISKAAVCFLRVVKCNGDIKTFSLFTQFKHAATVLT